MPPYLDAITSTVLLPLRPKMRRMLRSVPACSLRWLHSRSRPWTTCTPSLVSPLLTVHASVATSLIALRPPRLRRTSLLMSVLRSWRRLLHSRSLLLITCTPKFVSQLPTPLYLDATTSIDPQHPRQKKRRTPRSAPVCWQMQLLSRSWPLTSCTPRLELLLLTVRALAATSSTDLLPLRPKRRRMPRSGLVCWLRRLHSRSLPLTTCTLRLVLPPLMRLHLRATTSTATRLPRPRKTSSLMSVLRSWPKLLPSRSLQQITCIRKLEFQPRMPLCSAATTSTVLLLQRLRTSRKQRSVHACWLRLLLSRSLLLLTCILKLVWLPLTQLSMAATTSTASLPPKWRMLKMLRSVLLLWPMLLHSRSQLLTTCILKLVSPLLMLLALAATTSAVLLLRRQKKSNLVKSAPVCWLKLFLSRSLLLITCIPKLVLQPLTQLSLAATTLTVTLRRKQMLPRSKLKLLKPQEMWQW
mmetsp:Transcript_30135/g.63981  ORF Transcript_30135/g.63981 Transcript_30135/m.63981 type:complete len:469 (+) Transcript_30135:476-1882(+)